MSATDHTSHDPSPHPSSPSSSWTYPTRTCRYCLEDVPATVTLYPPGLPLAFQRPIVEYKNDDEYGRLIKPCHCRGGMRYVHELCLRRARTESARPGSLWKCHQCGYQFNFTRLTIQKYLGSKKASGALTLLFMLVVMFFLGFVADPILNIYTDPYETIVGHENAWRPVEVNQVKDAGHGWGQHFVKGMVSMGVLSFVRQMILNPFHWFNIRNTGFVGGRVSGRSTTGRDRAVNVSWIMIAFGVITAFYLFYQWIQAIIGRYLQRIGNNIVDTQLPGDDDDLKPPPGFKVEESYPSIIESKASATSDASGMDEGFLSPLEQGIHLPPALSNSIRQKQGDESENSQTSNSQPPESVSMQTDSSHSTQGEGSMPGDWESVAYSSALDDAHDQGWSFRGL